VSIFCARIDVEELMATDGVGHLEQWFLVMF
jgi:hypothetical protein